MMFRPTLLLLAPMAATSTAADSPSLRAARRQLQPVDPTTLTNEQIEGMTKEEWEEEAEYMGCLCPCKLPDGKEGVLIHTKDMATDAAYDFASGDEEVEASHVLCVDDLLSIEFVAEGRGTCDEECLFEGDDDAEESDGTDDLFDREDSEEDSENGEEPDSEDEDYGEDDLEEYEDSEEDLDSTSVEEDSGDYP